MVKKPVAAVAKVTIPQQIRDYFTANPKAKPAEIAKALTDKGVRCNEARVVGTLRAAAPKIDVEMIKAAATYCKQFDGDREEAEAAIERVASFLEVCGSADKAKIAIGSYVDIAEQLS